MMRAFLLILTIWSGVPAAWSQDGSPAPRVYFITPRDGETLRSPFVVRFGLSGMGVAPAGIDVPNTGHHHLLIDVDAPALDQPIASDDRHRHFGGGQTETELSLPPGEHSLQLLLGDHVHRPHQPPLLSERIVVRVR